MFKYPEVVSSSCELFTALASNNPQVLVDCKDIVYALAKHNKKYTANTGMILTQVAISIKVGWLSLHVHTHTHVFVTLLARVVWWSSMFIEVLTFYYVNYLIVL